MRSGNVGLRFAARPCFFASVLQTLATFLREPLEAAPRGWYLLNSDGSLNSGSPRVHRRRIGDGARLTASPDEQKTNVKLKIKVVESRVVGSEKIRK